jgi:hypothetical protein
MDIKINGESLSYTDIVIENTNGDVVFNGDLHLRPDWWVLRDITNTILGRWSSKRSHLSALIEALRVVDRSLKKD